MNVDAEFQKAVPLTEGGFWTDFLQMTPGVLSRPHNDGSGRQNYYASGVEHREHVTQMDGFMAANYWDMNVNRTGLSGEAISDTNVKLAGVDAAAPDGLRPRHQHDLEERRQFPLGLGRIHPRAATHGTGTTPPRTGRKASSARRAPGKSTSSTCRWAGRFGRTRSGSSAPIAGRSSIRRWTARRPTSGPSRRSGPTSRQFPGERAALTPAVREGDLAPQRQITSSWASIQYDRMRQQLGPLERGRAHDA